MVILFLGTPEFAVPSLEALVQAGHTVKAVYTQPDRPKGRGQQETASPVKQCALRLGLEVRQPLKIRSVVEEIAADQPDMMVVVGYGQIIPQSIIDIPRFGIVNVHGSLLPKYRGAAPIQWAVANGETVTGVTTMLINAGLDTGDMLLKAETAIGSMETAVELGERLAALGADLLIGTVEGLERGTLRPAPQDDAEATYAPILKKEDGQIDWNQPAERIAWRTRGFQPWPGAYTRFRGQRLNIWACRAVEGETPAISGRPYSRGHRLFVACGEGSVLEILELQMEGRKRMSAASFLNGVKLLTEDQLG